MSINENDSTYHLFYGFNDPEGQNLALFAISMIKPIPNQKELFLFDKTSRTTGYGGLVSARQLHFICGPYPESIINNNLLFDKIIQTSILPILLILLIIFNSLSITVLIKPTMKTPVFTVLLSITIIEMFNGILPLPMYLLRGFYNDPIWWENNKYTLYNLTQISKWWKYAPIEMYQTSSNPIISGILAWTTVYLPTVCHTTVTWLTLFVALQRLIYITYPNKAENLFTIRIVRIVCISVLLCALLLHIPMFQSTFIKFQPLRLHHNVIFRNYSIDFKQILLYEALDYLPYVVMKCYTCLPIQMFLYFITRIILIHLLPCICLIILTILIIIRMRQINKKHLYLIQGRFSLQSNQILPISRSYSLPHCYKSNITIETNLLSKQYQCNNQQNKNKLNYFNCFTMNKTNTLINNEQINQQFQSNILHNNFPLSILYNNTNDNNQTIIKTKSQITEFFNVSNMLIVILIKFILIHLPNALVIFIYALTLIQKRIYERLDDANHHHHHHHHRYQQYNNNSIGKYYHETMPIVQVTNQTIYLPYTIMELDTINTMININDESINLLWIRIVMICNLLILCSYLMNLLIFWTMSTPFRLQFNKLFKWKSSCVKK